VTVWGDFEAFVAAHRDHGPIAVISTPPDETGYDVEAACPCGAAQSRWVTLAEALKDLSSTDASPVAGSARRPAPPRRPSLQWRTPDAGLLPHELDGDAVGVLSFSGVLCCACSSSTSPKRPQEAAARSVNCALSSTQPTKESNMLKIKSIFARALVVATVSACGGQDQEASGEPRKFSPGDAVRTTRAVTISYASPGFHHLWFSGTGFPRNSQVLVDLFESAYEPGTSRWIETRQQQYVQTDAGGVLKAGFFDIGTRDCQRRFWVRGLEIYTGIYSRWSPVTSFARTCVN
jgi:hypothetical protein